MIWIFFDFFIFHIKILKYKINYEFYPILISNDNLVLYASHY